MAGEKSHVLELAVLGSLNETPLHGYELRKRLNAMLGMFRAFSYGSLYPCLRSLLNRGLIAEEQPAPEGVAALPGRRSKIVYKLTAEGKERLQELLTQSGPSAWEDESFGVHFAFFRHTEPRCACASSKDGAAVWKNGWRASVRLSPAPASVWTATRSNSTGTGSNPSNARCAGSTS